VKAELRMCSVLSCSVPEPSPLTVVRCAMRAADWSTAVRLIKTERVGYEIYWQPDPTKSLTSRHRGGGTFLWSAVTGDDMYVGEPTPIPMSVCRNCAAVVHL
jgi:hypothetical protein